MLVQLPPTANSMMNVVRRIIITAMPSTPSVKRIPHDGIHDQSTTDCHAATDGSKLHQRPSDTTNSIANITSAIMRGTLAVPVATSSSPWVDRPTLCTQMPTAPINGMARRAGSTQCW